MAKKKGKTKEQADMIVDDELETTEHIETPTLDKMGITLRSLTRKQRRELRNVNLDPALTKFPGESEEDDDRERLLLTEDMIDWMLENVYSDFNFDDVPNQECMKLALDTYTFAMGRPPADRLKN